ncbi:uncharacterized protein LOC134828032 [Culicoides brevitarsis]|uniref:uncharacterized protein LOC134828032 n=1 Tax=Culicoides brevitarsis TaxID=469753 RepID=UPI00307BE19D
MSISVIERKNIELPFTLPLPGGLSVPDKLEFGVNLEDDSCLAITFKTADDDLIDSRVPLSLSLSLERVICKSGKNKQWDHVELVKRFKIPKNFRLGIVTRNTGYRLEVNGNLYCSFPHQFPPSAVQNLQISLEKGTGSVNFLTLLKEIRWISAKIGSQIAGIALEAGRDDENNGIYVARGLKNNKLLVVSVNYAKNKATVALEGKEWPIEDFTVLQNGSFFGWKRLLEDKSLPARAVEAGFDENGNILYVGRVAHERNLLLGSVNIGNSVLSVPFKGKELKFSSNYEVLTILTPKEVKNIEQANIFNQKLRELDSRGYIPNSESFDCAICMDKCQRGDGVILRECLHEFCKECLANHIKHSDEAAVKCPFQDDVYQCLCFLQDREIRAIVTMELYKKHLAKSLRQAESQMENTFHCLVANCEGWCTYDENVIMFVCPICQARNCLKCKVIHDGTCEEYHEKLKRDRELQQKAENDKQTQAQMDAMLRNREVMECPKCGAIIQKTQGCDGMICAVCRVSICWATRGLRWGPRGVGDTSGGCRCKVNGMRCAPNCQNCH